MNLDIIVSILGNIHPVKCHEGRCGVEV